jgi:hypothetical protein
VKQKTRSPLFRMEQKSPALFHVEHSGGVDCEIDWERDLSTGIPGQSLKTGGKTPPVKNFR